MVTYTDILTSEADGVLTITLNRPDRLNAWTGTMQAELQDAIVKGVNSADVRCIVITGAGRGFCAGADMDGLQKIAPGDDGGTKAEAPATKDLFPDAPGPDVSETYAGRFGYLYACPKPIIAAINGACAGIGFVFSLFADLRFAAREAKFTTAFAQRGLIAEHGISWVLPRLIGEANALDLLLTARKFTGDEAERLGLVNKALPVDELAAHVGEVAKLLAETVSPRSVAVMKRQVRANYAQSYGESLAIADAEMQASFATFDFKEGVASFVERRPAQFRGT